MAEAALDNESIEGQVVKKKKRVRHKRGRPIIRKSYRRARKGLPTNNPRGRSREAMIEISKIAAARGGRVGVPDGMTKATAMVLWAKAREKADWIMAELEKHEVIAFDPNQPEDVMAREVLKEAFAIAMSPKRDTSAKLSAIRTVLEYTKAKPATKTDLKLSTAESWLQEVVIDHQQSRIKAGAATLADGLRLLEPPLRSDQD